MAKMASLPDLSALSSEAATLLDRAKQLRAKMEELPPGDPQRADLEQVIRDLLRTANSISDVVKSSIPRP
jgi:hypothetical protein